MPTARFYDESSHGFTVYDGSPDQKFTFTSAPFDWLEASVFYSNIQGKPMPGFEYQDYKDKGFNVKLRLKEEGILPAVAIGINDIAGTGYYSSEYLVASYGINKIDLHFGLAWGALNGSKNKFKNPLSYLSDSFLDRPTGTEDQGGQFQASRYFSGDKLPFFGISYALNDRTLIKIENDITKTPGKVGYKEAEQDFHRYRFNINKNFSIGI